MIDSKHLCLDSNIVEVHANVGIDNDSALV